MERTAIPMWLTALTGVMVGSLPCRPRASLEFDEHLPLLDRVADVDVDLGDFPGDGGGDDGLHLHRLEHEQDVVDLDRLADLGVDARDHARERAAADLALVG